MGRLTALCQLIWIMIDWRSAPCLLLCLALCILYGVCYALFTTMTASLQDAILSKDGHRRVHSMIYLALAIAGGSLAAAFMLYTGDLLINVTWRKSLNDYISQLYFQPRVAFRLALIDDRIRDADQRIGSDMVAFCAQMKQVMIGAPMFLGIVPLIATIIAFTVSLIKSIGVFAPLMAYLVCAFFLIINFVLMRTPQGLAKLATSAAGSFRFAHTYIRLHCESIALMGGEQHQRQHCKALMKTLAKRTNAESRADIALNVNSNVFYWGAGMAAAVIPFLCLKIQGATDVNQAKFLAASGYISELIYQMAVIALLFRDLSQLCALADRVYELILALKDLLAADVSILIDHPGGHPDIDEIAFEQVTLQTPANLLLFPAGVSFIVRSGGTNNVLIMGPNGIGKSSLIRALGGLWPVKSGQIRKPVDPSAIFFVPQRPLMTMGTLRQQIAFPADGKTLSDEVAVSLLKDVGLDKFTNQLDVETLWPEVMSGGEQQRLSFARVLFLNPRFAVLDESTSAMDEVGEAVCYQMLLQSNTGLLSIGHRSTIARFHHLLVQINASGESSNVDINLYGDSSSTRESSNTATTASYDSFRSEMKDIGDSFRSGIKEIDDSFQSEIKEIGESKNEIKPDSESSNNEMNKTVELTEIKANGESSNTELSETGESNTKINDANTRS